MWLVTEDGFFSLACAEAHGLEAPYWEGHDFNPKAYVLVRTRDKSSLEEMLKRIQACGVEGVQPKEGEWTGRIWSSEETDYEHRMLVTNNAWMNYLGSVCRDMAYDNFKPACHRRWYETVGWEQAEMRHNVLVRIWSVLFHGWPRDKGHERLNTVTH